MDRVYACVFDILLPILWSLAYICDDNTSPDILEWEVSSFLAQFEECSDFFSLSVGFPL